MPGMIYKMHTYLCHVTLFENVHISFFFGASKKRKMSKAETIIAKREKEKNILRFNAI